MRPRRRHHYEEVRPRHKYEEIASTHVEPSKSAQFSTNTKEKAVKRNASDSKLSRWSARRHSAKDSPSAAKRLSATSPVETYEEKEAIKKQNRISSPEVQLERMRQRYFPDDVPHSLAPVNFERDDSPDVLVGQMHVHRLLCSHSYLMYNVTLCGCMAVCRYHIAGKFRWVQAFVVFAGQITTTKI